MSATGRIVRMHTPGESELGPVSPELALVDPELARSARELLPDPPRPVAFAAQPALVEPRRIRVEPVPEPPRAPRPAPTPRRRRFRLGLLTSAAGVVALGVLLALIVGRGEPPALRTQPTQSVAAAVSPTEPTPTQPRSSVTTPTATTPTATTPTATTPTATTQTAPAPTSPAPSHATAVPGQTFVWVSSPDAAAYEFQLFQGGERVFRARVDEARLELPGQWRLAGRPHALLPGSYRWYVWTISKRTNRQSTKPTVSAKLVVDKQPQ
jgi:hypothetical protein